MPALYVANLTDQDHAFVYTRPATDTVPSKPIYQPIPKGQQIRAYNGENISEIDAIIKQHAPYGMIDAKLINSQKKYTGLAYSVNEPIDIDRILNGLDQNQMARVETALEARKNATVALNESLQESSGGGLRTLEIETVEETPKGQYPKMGDEVIKIEQTPMRSGNNRR
jgi:hypothetical protein